jgi:serine/threonine protein kinase
MRHACHGIGQTVHAGSTLCVRAEAAYHRANELVAVVERVLAVTSVDASDGAAAVAAATAAAQASGDDAVPLLWSPSITEVTDAENAAAGAELHAAHQLLPSAVRAIVARHQGVDVLCAAHPEQRYGFVRSLRGTLFGEVVLAAQLAQQQHASAAAASAAVQEPALVAVKLSFWRKFGEAAPRKRIENFMREARVIRDLSPMHPNMVRTIECAWDEERHWIVMEFVRGGELFDRVQAAGLGGLPADFSRHLFRQLLAALAFMHARGYCHLDVSLENALVTEDDDLKLFDFGQTRRFLRSAAGAVLPFRGDVPVCNKAYCRPPEMVLGQPVCGPAADVYGAVASLWTMRHGRHPPTALSTAWRECDAGRVARVSRHQCGCSECRALQAEADAAGAPGMGRSCRLSEAACALMARGLCMPHKRASVAELLEMDWMREAGAADEGEDEGEQAAE